MMWGKTVQKPPFQAGTSETTYIASDSKFSGTLTLKGNARIDGQIQGTLNVSGDLIIGPSAVIHAKVQANTVSVSGKVQGDITSKESLELCQSAQVVGNICTLQLKVDQGAKFIGSSRLFGENDPDTLLEATPDIPNDVTKESSPEVPMKTSHEVSQSIPSETLEETSTNLTHEDLPEVSTEVSLETSLEEAVRQAVENKVSLDKPLQFTKKSKSRRR